MNRPVVAILIAGVAAAAVALVLATSPAPEHDGVPDTATGFDATADDRERIRALEQAVAAERAARQLLEDEVFTLIEEVDRLRDADTGPGDAAGAAEAAQDRAPAARVRPRVYEQSAAERRRDALVDGGFPPDEAARIVKRESELRMESMQARFDARASGEPFDPADPSLDPRTLLREELGDENFERYLESIGQPTSVPVSGVLESSPAQAVGLRPGDTIMRYDGRRVFNAFELNREIGSGQPGENVVIDIVRDGAPMQVVVSRGPLGVMIGRSR